MERFKNLLTLNLLFWIYTNSYILEIVVLKKLTDEVGKIYQTTKSGNALVVEYVSSVKVLVRFLNSGFEKYFKLKDVRLGTILDPTAKPLGVIGRTYLTKNSGSCRVVDYVSCREVLVEFDDGYRKWCEHGQLRRGDVKNPYYPRIEGVGYIGEGIFSSPVSTKEGAQAYLLWKNLLKRCYNVEFLERYPTYKGCFVAEEWKNFNTFASWCIAQKGFLCSDKDGRLFHLDKDILGDGIEYSPENCCFIPAHLNSCFKKSKDCVRKYYNKWVVSSSKLGHITKYFGLFETKEEAIVKHLDIKKSLVESILRDYEDTLPISVVEAALKKSKSFDFVPVTLNLY